MVWLLEGLLAEEFGIIWEEHHGGPFGIRQCSRVLSNVDILELNVRHYVRSSLTAEPVIQATFYLSRREQGSMLTQFSIVFAASTNPIRVYLGSRLTLGTSR